MSNTFIPNLSYKVARLEVPKFILGLNQWLGWNIRFEPGIRPSQIIDLAKPNVETALNKYLERNMDTVLNHLLVPFSDTVTATINPLIDNFKIKVLIENKFHVKELFEYPFKPVRRVDGYLIDTANFGRSHVNTVTPAPGRLKKSIMAKISS